MSADAAPGRWSWPRRILVALSSLVALLLASSCVAVRVLSRRLVFPDVRLERRGEPRLPDGVEVVDYASPDGLPLRGYFLPAAPTAGSGERAPVLVFFHGNAEAAGDSLPFAEALRGLGVSTFLAEYRGYGGSTAPPTQAGLYADGLAAVEAARGRGGALTVGGWSLGTAVAVEAARRGHGARLLLLAPFTSIVDVARAMGRDPDFERGARKMLGDWASLWDVGRGALDSPVAWLVVADPFESRAKIADVRVPTLVVHARDDGIVPFAHGEELARRAREGRLEALEDGGHYVHGRPSVVRRVAAFVRGE